jgi:hypothetical protein
MHDRHDPIPGEVHAEVSEAHLSSLERARCAMLRLQLEVAGGPATKARLALLGVGSLLALTVQVKGAGAHLATPDMWASSGCGSACANCTCWPCQRCCP